MNESKHVEMHNWLNKVEKLQSFNNDVFAELKQDQDIVNRLEKNFA